MIYFSTIGNSAQRSGWRNRSVCLSVRTRCFPGEGRIRVAFPHQVQGEVTFTLHSSVGAELSSGVAHMATPAREVELDFSRQMQTAGVYYLRLKGQGLEAVLKVVRQ